MTAAVWVALIGSGLVTYLERLSFLGFADRADALSPAVKEALRMIPAAALAALVAPAVLRSGPDRAYALLDVRLLAAAVALVVMRRTGNVLGTIVVGMAVLLVGEALLG